MVRTNILRGGARMRSCEAVLTFAAGGAMSATAATESALNESSLDKAASIKDWLGHTRRDEDEIALGAVQRLAATLDQDPHAFKRGSAAAGELVRDPVRHAGAARASSVADGHPVTGDFMPPMQGTRRMFAGRRATFHRPLKIGDTVTRLSTVSQRRAQDRAHRRVHPGHRRPTR